jgi:NADPH:quinone reductase-like Zn-dependent oxidoreductase
MSDSNLSMAHLHAKLTYANLSRCDMRRVDLRYADLEGAKSSNKTLVSMKGGDLTVSEMVKWLAQFPPNVKAQLQSALGGEMVESGENIGALGGALGHRKIRLRGEPVGEEQYVTGTRRVVYHREGRYPVALPFVIGQEGAGVISAVGANVKSVNPGDRVAWTGIMGSYAEYVAVPADRLVKIPQGVSEREAAAVMLQGMTAHYLAYATFPLKRGDTALVHAAAGGVGLLLVQLAHNIGARVIGTVSTEEKARLARDAGADEIIFYTQTDFESETKRLTGGKGVDVVYDSVGKTTFEKGLNILRPRGMMVLFGGSSGAAPSLDPIASGRAGIRGATSLSTSARAG